MKTRIITSIVAVALLVPFCVFSASPAFVFLILAGVISFVAAYEILKCTGLDKNIAASLITYPVSLAAPILTRVVDSTERYFMIMSFVWFAMLFLSFVNATFSKGKVGVCEAAISSMMTVYVSFSLSALVLLRDMSVTVDTERVVFGGKLYLLAFLFAWVPDIGGYFFGRFFGKRKLIPDVSPKKTVAGFVGGIICAVVVAVVYGFIIGLREWSGFLVLAVLGAVCAVVSVCGDLLASLVKRHYGIKDYGFVFPGHGGVLDRFDSVIAVTPFLYILCTVANAFGLFHSFV